MRYRSVWYTYTDSYIDSYVHRIIESRLKRVGEAVTNPASAGPNSARMPRRLGDARACAYEPGSEYHPEEYYWADTSKVPSVKAQARTQHIP